MEWLGAKQIYWLSTGAVCLMLAASAATYFFHQNTIDGIRELGFPDFFRVQLGILKVIALIVLLVPIGLLPAELNPMQIKEWAYAGVAFFFLTAIVAHTAHGDPVALSLVSVFFLIVLFISNRSMHALWGI